MNKISIILPVYNGENYLHKLISNIRNQNINFPIEIIAPVSKSKDNSLQIAKELCDIYYHVSDFNHSKTRHEAALKSTGDILVFITQDIMPYNEHWLSNLVQPLLEENNIVATYSRQIAHPNATETEKIIREFNYPDFDRICNNKTIEKWGRKNIYYSDASSATIKDYFLSLGGYDFEVGTNEDVVYALNVINNNKSILYNSQSIVYHSHNFEIKSAYSRYKLIGQFEREYKNQLERYSSMGEGKRMLIYLLRRLILKFKIKDLIILPIDMITRYWGYKKGYANKY